MYTYVQRPGCKKENTATYVYIQAGSRMPTRAYIRTARARVHGWVGTEKQRHRRVHGEATECVVFMGRQRNASCSSGGNGTPAGHREPTGLDGTANGHEAWRTAERRKRTSYIRNRVLLIRRGLVYRKTEETDLLRSKRGSC